MPSATKSRAVSTERDAIALLKDDHKKVRGLLGEMEATTDKAGAKRA